MDCTQRMYSDDVVDNHTRDEIGYLGICGKQHAIKMGPNKIGRDTCCDIVIDHASLSRQHAVINVLSAKNFMLMDLGSVNKTKLGIKNLQPYLAHNLKHGDTLQFGEVFGVFLLNAVDDQLPMTQAFTEVADTPVHVRPHATHRLQATAIPESPDLNTSEEDSFILSSQQQGNSFHRPKKNAIKQKKNILPASFNNSKDDSNDSIFWNASTQSLSINFNLEDSDTTFDEGKKESIGKVINRKNVDSKNIEVSEKENIENIHEALTQLPSPSTRSLSTHLSIHEIDTQMLDNDVAKIDVAGDNNLSNVEDIDIHERSTQLDNIPEKCIQDVIGLSGNVSIHEAETQDFFIQKKNYLSDIHEAETQDFMKNDSIVAKSMEKSNVSIHESAIQNILVQDKRALSVDQISLAAVLQNVSNRKTIDITKETTMNDAETREFLDEETIIIDCSAIEENVSKTVEVSYQNRSTKTKEKTSQVQNNNEVDTKGASESDDEIIFDEFESQGFGEKEESSQAITLEDINENISKRKSDNVCENNSEKKEYGGIETDCENIDVVKDDNDSTDCEEELEKDRDEVVWDDNEKTVLVPVTPNVLSSVERKPNADILDITEASTQILDKLDEIAVDYSYAKKSTTGFSKTFVTNDLDDDISNALTQILPGAVLLSDCLTQKIKDCSPIPNQIVKSTNTFKVPISSTPLNIKKKSPMSLKKEKSTISSIHIDPRPTQKITDDKFYSNTQELMEDLSTQKEDSISNLLNINPNTPKVSNEEQKQTEIGDKNKNMDSWATPLDRQGYDTTQDILADLLTQKVPEEHQRHINRTNITVNKLADKISQYTNDTSDIESQDVDLLSLSKSSIPAGAVRREISSLDKMLNGDDDEIIPSAQENDSIDENMRFPGINKNLSLYQNIAESAQKSDYSSSSDGVTAASKFEALLSLQQVRECIGADDVNDFYKIPTPLVTPKKSARFSSDTSDNDNTPKKQRNQPKMGVLDVELPNSQEIIRHVSRLPNCTIVETSSDSDSCPENANTPVVHRRKVPIRKKKDNVSEPNNIQLLLPTRVITRKRSPTEKLIANTKLKSIITNKVLQVEESENPLDYNINAEIINENLKRLSNEKHKKTNEDNVGINKPKKPTTTKQCLKGISAVTKECDTFVIHTENLKSPRYQKSKEEKCSNETVKKKQNYKNSSKTDTQSKRRTTRKTSKDVTLQHTKAVEVREFPSADHNLQTVTSRIKDRAKSKEKKNCISLKTQADSNKEKVEIKRTTQSTVKETSGDEVTETKHVTNINKQPELRSRRHKRTDDSQYIKEKSTKHGKQNDRTKNSHEEIVHHRTRNSKDIKQETSKQSLVKLNTSIEDITINKGEDKKKGSAKTKFIESNNSQDKINNKRTRNTKDIQQEKISNHKLDDINSSEEDMIIIPSRISRHKNSKSSKPKFKESNSSRDGNADRQAQSETQKDATSKRIGNNTDTRTKSQLAVDKIPTKRSERNKRNAAIEKVCVKEPPLKIRRVEYSSSVFGDSDSVPNQVSIHNTRKRPLTPAPVVEEHSTPRKMRRNMKDMNSQKSPCIARTGTPSRFSLRPKQNVMFTAFTDNNMEAIVKKLGASIVSDALACTVLVTPNIKRTVKLLCAVGLGRPIVGPSWIQACQHANTLVDPWLHLLKDVEAEKRFRFSLAKTLGGPRNFLYGKVLSATPSVLPAPHEMQTIVECSGGSWCDPFKSGPDAWLCVSTAADSHLWPALRTRGATVLSVEAVLSGVLQQTLHVRQHTLK